MEDFDLKKYLSEGKLLNEDRSSISLFMEDMLGDFLQFVVTVEEGLEAKYDNPEDLTILKERKEEMLKAMDSYVEFLVIIDEKSEALDIDKQ